MFERGRIEIIVGIFILCLSFGFMGYIYLNYFHDVKKYYVLYAEFDNATNLFPGAKVILSGIEIGHVESIALNHQNYSVNVVMHIDSDVQIPVDSSIRIVSSSLFGGELKLYIDPNIIETEFLQPNDKFLSCHSVITIDQLITKFASKMIG